MRRGRRERLENNNNIKYLVYTSGGIALVMLLTFAITFIVYNNKLKKSDFSALTTEKISELVPNYTGIELEQASSDIGKTIDEVINTIEKQQNNEENKIETSNKVEESKNEIEDPRKEIQTNETVEKVEVIKDPEFSMPVEGDIEKGFAKDSLIYSETLKEWVVHLGIDIKADRTTVVKSAEKGKITSIKNDPRYGLTVVIEHVNGFKTIYSNLLTTEFVTEGEEIEKGEAIGTIGNSASFEIVDEPHLHFEIVKDNVNVDPNIYLK